MRKKLILICLCFWIGNFAFSQEITFDVDNILAGPAQGNWMFDSDDPNFFTHDGNPFTLGAIDDFHNYAYVGFNWTEGAPQSESFCLSEQLDVLENIENVTLKLNNFILSSFEHLNTEDPNQAWNISGEAGDKRHYMNGIGEIYVDGELKLRVTNCRLTVETPYPTAAEMQNILAPWGGQNWQNDVGSGEEVIGSGWGMIDEINSDPDWVTEFDPLGWNMLRFEVGTFNEVIQGNYGYYDFEITVQPAPYFELDLVLELPENRGTILDFSEADIICDFADGAVSGGAPPEADTLRSVMVSQIKKDPGGDLPTSINAIAPIYWEIGTNLASYTADITFDLEEIGTYDDPNDLRILKRNHANAEWFIWNDFTLVDALHLRANNVSDFSQWTIGSTQDDPLPISLSFFSAIYEKEAVSIYWTSEFEEENLGWNIYRGTNSQAITNDDVIKINNNLIAGAGNSQNPLEYNFTDENYILKGKTYWYWLEDVSSNGQTQIHNPTSVKIPLHETPEILSRYGLRQNYPNPFNPTTIINFKLPPQQAGKAELVIFNTKGQKIKTFSDLVTDERDNGFVIWNGKDESGNEVASGIYLYQLQGYQQENSEMRKMILVK